MLVLTPLFLGDLNSLIEKAEPGKADNFGFKGCKTSHFQVEILHQFGVLFGVDMPVCFDLQVAVDRFYL